MPEKAERRPGLIPDEYVPRLNKFLDLLCDNEISEEQFIQWLDVMARPTLDEAMKHEEVRAILEDQVNGLVGKKIWVKTKSGQPWVVEIVRLPQIIKMYTIKEEEIKQQGLPGVTYDAGILRDALNGKFNPMLAMMSGKIRITGLTELMKLSTPLITAFSPLKNKEEFKSSASNQFLAALNRALMQVGC